MNADDRMELSRQDPAFAALLIAVLGSDRPNPQALQQQAAATIQKMDFSLRPHEAGAMAVAALIVGYDQLADDLYCQAYNTRETIDFATHTLTSRHINQPENRYSRNCYRLMLLGLVVGCQPPSANKEEQLKWQAATGAARHLWAVMSRDDISTENYWQHLSQQESCQERFWQVIDDHEGKQWGLLWHVVNNKLPTRDQWGLQVV